MGYFDDAENVAAYEKMAEGYDGKELVQRLRLHLPGGSTVLELGMGPGTDLDLLNHHFEATGSDSSKVFLDRYRARQPSADLLFLDAETVATDRRFSAIYSNKVLHHLARPKLRAALRRHAEVLVPGGFAVHSFWHGDKEEEHHGLRFVYYTESTLQEAIPDDFEMLELTRYSELSRGDSMVLVLRKPV